MNYLFGTVLAIAGVTILIYNKSFAARWRIFNANQFNKSLSNIAKAFRWDNPDRPFVVFLFRLLTIFLGIFLLIVAFHSFFGTIYLRYAQIH